jgi:hypothetical protein
MKNYFESAARIVFVITLVTLASCGNDESPVKKEELPGNWKLTALTVKAAGQTGDAYGDLDPTEQDNIYSYDANGTYQIKEGATKFAPSDPDIIESGTWEINGKHLTMVGIGTDPETVDIQLLNATTLKCAYTLDFFGVSATFNATYTKQNP